MSDNLYEIKMPELSDANFGASLKEQFENIDSNFKIISGTELLKGNPGDSARWIVFDLDSIFFKSKTESIYDSDSISDISPNISTYYTVYENICGGSFDEYRTMCLKFLFGASYDNIENISDISSNSIVGCIFNNFSSEELKPVRIDITYYYAFWVANWWIAYNNSTTDPDTYESAAEIFEHNITEFRPGCLIVACNIKEDGSLEPMSSNPYPVLDLRFRNGDISGDMSDYESIYKSLIDSSGSVVGSIDNNNSDDYLIFTYVVNLFNIYYNSDIKNFCWVLNGQQTKLVVQVDTESLMATVDDTVNSINSVTTDLQDITDDISEIEDSIEEINIKTNLTSSDSTIIIQTITNNGQDLTVNIDNETLIENSGVISVNSTALSQYIGEDAISVTETDTDEKTISLVIDSDSESYLSQSSSGLLLTGIDSAISTAINALDVTEIGGDGYMITTISETDGIISASVVEASASNISASEITESDSTIAVSGTTVEAQIESLAESIYSIQTFPTQYVGGEAITISDSDTDTNTKIVDVNYDNTTIGLNSNTNELYVINALSDSEKSWIEDELFDTLFTVSISRSVSSFVFTGSDYTITWTLTCKYDGTLVDLDSVPSGWTYSSTGTYTKTTTVTSDTTGSSVSSYSVSCTYNERSKTASSVSCTIVKYSYIYKTTDESLSSLDNINFDKDATQMQSSITNTISGTYTIDFTEGQYAYFIISNTSSVSSITQLGLNYVNSGESMTRTNYGTYTVYRSTQSMSASTQEVTVA